MCCDLEIKKRKIDLFDLSTLYRNGRVWHKVRFTLLSSQEITFVIIDCDYKIFDSLP